MKSGKSRALALSCLATGLVVVLFLATGGNGTGIATAQEAKATAASTSAASALPDARPGECYAKVFVSSQYKTITEEIRFCNCALPRWDSTIGICHVQYFVCTNQVV